MEDKVKQEIENIAWQIFLNRSGISFRRELTPEERKSVTDVESYKYYREQATKLYEKKQNALQNKKYPVIEIPADGKSGMMGGAYCLCFVYSKYKGNFVLKGYMREVEEYLKKNYTHYFCNFSLWYLGQNRDIWSFWKKKVGIFIPSDRDRGKGKKITVRPYTDWYDRTEETEKENKERELSFKRLPKRWIPEFDKL